MKTALQLDTYNNMENGECALGCHKILRDAAVHIKVQQSDKMFIY